MWQLPDSEKLQYKIQEAADSLRLSNLWPFSVISGVGELNIDRNNQKMASELVSSPEPTDRPYTDCPYLLLDVRDRDEYDCCHIISGR